MSILVERESNVSRSLEQVIEVFDRELRSDLPFVNRLTERVRRYRGKMLRPRLLLLSAEASGEIKPEHIVLGAVVEMVHMATLVHDDVLDEADVRRHGPTANRLVGNEAAVLLGDYLISHAYHLCSSLGSAHTSRRIADATNTVCEGELLQVENRGNFALSEEVYLEIVRRKTAELTRVCCELGADTAGATPDVVEHLSAFGRDLGTAFQIVDDLLDLNGSESETGKTVGRDADLGKLTLPLIRFLDRARPGERNQLISLLTDDRSNVTLVRSALTGSDAIEYAMETAASFVTSAVTHVSCLPDGDAKRALTSAAEFVLRRKH